MASVYTPTTTLHGSYALPSDGDPAVAESVNDALRDLADGVLNANTNASSALALALQSVNGTTGGSYAPAAPIIIAGAGLRVNNAALQLLGTASLSVAATGSFTVECLSVLSEVTATNVSVTGSLNASNSQTFSGGTTINSTLNAASNVILGSGPSRTLIINATTTVNGDMTFEGGGAIFKHTTDFQNGVVLGNSGADEISILGTPVLNTAMQFAGVGRIPYRAPISLPTGGATVTVADGEIFIVPTNATGNYTASTSGVEDGDRMRFFCTGAMTSSRTVVAGSATFVMAAGNTTFVELIYSSGWKIAMYSFF